MASGKPKENQRNIISTQFLIPPPTMLSRRGAASAATLDIPWRFANKTNNPYNAVTNPDGIVLFSSAENVRRRMFFIKSRSPYCRR